MTANATDRSTAAQAFARALTALNEGRADAAAAIAESLRQQLPGDASVSQLLAAVALQRGQPAEAERWALASLDARPDHAATWLLAARAARALGQLPAALDRFRRAAALDPGRPEAPFGALAVAIRLSDEAVQPAIEDLAARFPDHAAGWAEIGALLEQGAHWEGAAQAYGLALRTRPSATLCIRHGTALQALGRRGEAAVLFQRALQLDPGWAEAWFRLGVSFQDGRHPAQAADAYRRALALNPDFVEAHTNLGVVLQEMGDLAAAKQAYGRALALRPSTFGRIAQALTTAPHGELWLDLAALRDHLSEAGRLSR